MEINIEDYVSADEIKQAILFAVKEKVFNMNESDIERIYTNACYRAVTKYSDEVIEEKGMEFSIEEQVKKIVNELSTFSVFYRDPFTDRGSKAYELTQKIVQEEKNELRKVIKSKLNEAYQQVDAHKDIAQLMSDAVYDIFNITKKGVINHH